MHSEHPLFRRFEDEFEFVWPSDKRIFAVEWTRRNGDVFFRPLGAPLWLLWHALDELNRREPDVVLDESLHNDQLWRVFVVAPDELLLLNSSQCLLTKEGAKRGAVLYGDFKRQNLDIDNLLLTPVTTWEEIFGLRPDELERTRSWLQNYEEGWSSLRFDSGSKEELKPLFAASLQLFIDFDTTQEYRRGGFEWFERQGNEVVINARWNEEIPSQLCAALSSHFSLVYESRLYVRGFSGWLRAWETLPVVPVSAPSAHERLEALLLWRDFLRGKMTPAEIESLLTRDAK